LLEMLRKRVGLPLSYRSLAEDLQVSPNTVRHYVDILVALYIVFLVRLCHQNISRSIQKELIEVKSSDTRPANDLCYFKNRLPAVRAVQVVQNLRDPIYHRGSDIHIMNAGEYLAGLSG